MDMPTVDTAAEAYLPRSAYTVSRVAADPKAQGHEQALDTVHGNLKLALRERDDALEQVQIEHLEYDRGRPKSRDEHLEHARGRPRSS